MLYQGDAHRYRALIKRKQRKQRAFGSILITLSISLMFYAIPCFAVSVFDYDDQVTGGIAFSSAISDHAGSDMTAGSAVQAPTGEAAAGAASTAGSAIMSETVGPAMLADRAAVDSAIKRAQAMQAVTSVQNTMVTAPAVAEADLPAEQPNRNVLPAVAAFAVAVVCGILGLRMITHSRRMLGRRITAEYGSALRAC